MTNKQIPDDSVPSKDNAQVSKQKTIPASDVGISLTISSEALKEIDRIRAETYKAAHKAEKYLWR